MFATLLQVALGGAIGSAARYLTNVGAARLFGAGFPWGTIIVNVAGSFLMGLLVALLAQRDAMRLVPFLMTGILGGYTTFSTFSLETIVLLEAGHTGHALAYMLGSALLCVALAGGAIALTRALV